MSHVNVNDVTSCPIALACEGCNSDGERGHLLEVTTFTSPTLGGVLCATLCERCLADDSVRPTLDGSNTELVARIWQHCRHLGINPDEMAALIELETTS